LGFLPSLEIHLHRTLAASSHEYQLSFPTSVRINTNKSSTLW
jgi:hypothetical protein